MSAPVPSTRRLAIAIGTAATATTFAIGVTAASLLGWFAPRAEPAPEPASSAPTATPASSPVILVPVEPTPAPTGPTGEVQLAMESDDDREHHGREHHGRDHDEREEDHDDD